MLVSFGYWTLGMRGMMITVEGEDYMHLARAKGLNPFYVLYRYMVRNAILPQITAFAITIGTLVALAAYVTRLYQPLMALTNARVDLMSALVSFERVFEVLDAKVPLEDRPGAVDLVEPRGAIDLDDVWFAYPRDAIVSTLELDPTVVTPTPVADGVALHGKGRRDDLAPLRREDPCRSGVDVWEEHALYASPQQSHPRPRLSLRPRNRPDPPGPPGRARGAQRPRGVGEDAPRPGGPGDQAGVRLPVRERVRGGVQPQPRHR